MLRTKRIALLLLMLSPFIFSNAWADKMEKPRIFIINGIYEFYENAADAIVKRVQRNGVEVKKDDNRITMPNDNKVLEDVINLGRQAQEQAATRNEDEGSMLDEKKGITVGINKHVITSVHFLSYSK